MLGAELLLAALLPRPAAAGACLSSLAADTSACYEAARPGPEAGDPFLDEIERTAFLYFAENADPVTGLVKDRAPADGSGAGKPDVASMASTGFGLSALCIGAGRGWMPKDEAAARARRTLEFLVERSTQVRGWFYHFTLQDGSRTWNSEVSSVDTGFLLAGALTAKGCFSGDKEIGRLADALYARMDFRWMMNGGDMLSHGWYPESGFIRTSWDTQSEHLLLTLLAIGAPSSPAPVSAWKAWRRETRAYGPYSYSGAAAPLFIHQYPQAWFDLHHLRDSAAPGTDLFANGVAATLAHRRFCVDISTAFPSYNADVWGITASDGSDGYHAWGGPPATPDIDGTVVPCAAGGSLMFLPREALATLKVMKARWGDKVWRRYGFVDAFNPRSGWYSRYTLGIDAGMTLLAAENLRGGAVWRWFMGNPEPRRALRLSGLAAGKDEEGPARR